MGLGSRIEFILVNVLILIPVFMIILASAIMSKRAVAAMKSVSGIDKEVEYVKAAEMTLWILFVGGLAFMFTIGMFIMPWLVTIPYLFGIVMMVFAIGNLALAAIMFYSAAKVSKTTAYTSKNKQALSAHKDLMITGIIMTVSALFVIGYTVFAIHKYRKGGGLRGDMALVGRYGGDIAMAAGQPEFAVPLQAMGQRAEQGLAPAHMAELQQRQQQIGKWGQFAKEYKGSSGGMKGLKEILQKPGMLEEVGAMIA